MNPLSNHDKNNMNSRNRSINNLNAEQMFITIEKEEYDFIVSFYADDLGSTINF